VSSGLLAAVLWIATANHWPFASYRSHPDFFTFSGSWDASSYKRIAEHGYPSSLPVDATGKVTTNVWAFLPLYPAIVRAVMGVTGLPLYPAGVLVAIVFGGCAAAILHRLILAKASPLQARWATLFFCFGPMAFVLQVAYAESLFLALVFASLLLMVRRHYLWMIPVAVAAAFTRPGAVALALALGIHFVVRWRASETFPRRHRFAIVVAAAAIAVAGLAWSPIAAAATGVPGAYLQTELAYWVPLVGHQLFVPFSPWFLQGWQLLGFAGIVIVLALAGAFVWMLARPRVRQLGNEIVGFAASYGLYVFAVFLPQQSVLRIAMPLAPLLGSSALISSVRRRWSLLIAGVGLQAAAIVGLWFLSFP
jgi:hypothetical protein